MIQRLLRLCLILACLAAAAAETPLPPSGVTEGRTANEHKILVLLQAPPEHYRSGTAYGGSYGQGIGRAERRHVAEALAHDYTLHIVYDWPMPLVGVDCYVMEVPADADTASVLAALAHDKRVQWAEVMHTYHAEQYNDPLYPLQPVATAWHLSDLHHIATGRGVTVAVIDSAVQANHPDLAGQVVKSEDFVGGADPKGERHGTAVAGIIAAKADNGVGIVGVAPQAHLMALRACWQVSKDSTLCNSLSLARALHFAITERADIINLSLSGPPDKLLDKLLDVALARGIVVVTAWDRAAADGGFPASHGGVIAVSDDAGVPAKHTLSAPGHDVPSSVPGGQWDVVTGSSFAAAHVSGFYALLRELRPGAIPGKGDMDVMLTRVGAIDACATLTHLANPCACNCTIAQGEETVFHP